MSKPARVLEFFLARLDDKCSSISRFPDHLPDTLKALIARFPAGSLQLEVGIQTFNPAVQALISRKQDNNKTENNVRWLRTESQAHIHADLIFGLPGEDIESFAQGFDRLVGINPHEIQVGVLKRLRGTPIARHTAAHHMRYSPYPPYTVLATDCIDFPTMQRLTRFARYWDMIEFRAVSRRLGADLGRCTIRAFPIARRLALYRNPANAPDCTRSFVRFGACGFSRDHGMFE